MNPFDILEARFTPAYAQILAGLEKVTTIYPCPCCGRPSTLFQKTGYRFQDSSKTTHIMCPPCTIINQQNADFMGFENGKIGYKLSSFKSAFLIIPLDFQQPMQLYVGGKYVERLKSSNILQIVDLSGHRAKAALLEDTRPKLVIENSMRREMWLKAMRLSSEKQLNIATETGVVSVNHANYQRLKDALADAEFKPSDRKNLITQLRLQKMGYTQPTSTSFVNAMSMCNAELLDSIKDASQEPIGFLFMLDALSA